MRSSVVCLALLLALLKLSQFGLVAHDQFRISGFRHGLL